MMYNTFNMGIGMVLALKAEDADKAIAALEAMGEKAYLIGSIAAGEKGVDVC
jgi:phosphoribosylformylglycinamidine cyclo-ligase